MESIEITFTNLESKAGAATKRLTERLERLNRGYKEAKGEKGSSIDLKSNETHSRLFSSMYATLARSYIIVPQEGEMEEQREVQEGEAYDQHSPAGMHG